MSEDSSTAVMLQELLQQYRMDSKRVQLENTKVVSESEVR